VFGKRAASYTTSESHTDPHVLSRVVRLAAPRPGSTALDVATGTGHTAFALAPHVNLVVGLDLTPEMLAEARALRAERRAANVVFCVADAHTLPFRNASFDTVTCRRAAHHFADVHQALAEMRRVLRTDGRLVIDDRSVPEDDFVDRFMNHLDSLHDQSHVRQYRPAEWRAMLELAGFVLDALEPYVRLRPVTSLTERASPAAAREIERLVEELDDRQGKAIGLTGPEGERRFNHWYVLVAARAALSS
jgi:SAM-dependent methyltransferase